MWLYTKRTVDKNRQHKSSMIHTIWFPICIFLYFYTNTCYSQLIYNFLLNLKRLRFNKNCKCNCECFENNWQIKKLFILLLYIYCLLVFFCMIRWIQFSFFVVILFFLICLCFYLFYYFHITFFCSKWSHSFWKQSRYRTTA